jgi:hypothetical protein
MKVIILTICLMTAAVVHAQPTARAFPEFVVYDATAAPVSSTTFAVKRSVVIYLKPACRSCDQLLAALSRIEEPAFASHLVIIVGASVGEATAFSVRAIPKQLHSATWFADSQGHAWSALELKGLPVLMGVEGQRIDWRLAGAPPGHLLESVVRTWLGIPGAPK